MLADFHFLRPEWLIAIPLLLIAIFVLARRRLGPGSWYRVVSSALAPHVLSDKPVSGDNQRWWLTAIGAVILVLALAGPVWERIEQPVFRSDQALVVALDLSRSMDAQDVAPSRLVRARLKILDILERRADGQTALIVYSANAFTVTPLTSDTDTIAALVNSLSTDIMPSRGSYPVAAINKGRQLLEQAGAGNGEVLLITDGGSTPAVERAAREMVEAGYRLSVMGVGTRDGAPIPLPNGGFVTDRGGQIAVPRLEERSLRALAEIGEGQYSTLTSDNRDLDLLLSGEVGQRQATGDDQATDQWREEGPWLVLLLLPLAALSFRRGWVLVLLIFIIPFPQAVHADVWDDLWQTPDQQAKAALEAGDAETAAAQFDNNEWRAVANYRIGNYADSAADFADKDDTRSLYNLGTVLARQGHFESAIDAWDQVLEVDPDHEDAQYNRDLIARLLEQQEQQNSMQEGDGEGEGEGSEGEGEPTPGEDSPEGDPSSQSQNENGEGDPQNSEQSQEELDALQQELERAAEEARQQRETMTEAELAELRRAQEQELAMEQWLRRIPNDPGSLLRNKFRYQYRQHQVDQDGNSTWPDDEVQPW